MNQLNPNLHPEVQKLLSEGAQFFTETNANVTKRIPSFLTRITKCEKEANAIALHKKSYVYEVYVREGKNKKPEYFGFAVPQ